MSTNAEKDNSGWIRHLGEFEIFLELIARKGIMVTCYSLTLNSKLPLKEHDIREALVHLFRKLPNLRACIKPKEGKLWFHKMQKETIDFEILENADYQEEYEAMTNHIYNSLEGPLWCGRLLPLPEDTSCEMPEIKNDYPYQYYFLFGFHHAITDGTSSIKISNIFVNILNDIIAGNIIDDLEQLAEHVSSEQTDYLMMQAFQELKENPSEVKKYQDLMVGKLEDLLFLKAFPPPQNVKPKTLNLAYSLTKEDTSAFLQRCKKEGVTIHSGFCAVVNAALVDMMEKVGIKEDIYKIKNYHTINNRRYWQGDTSRAFGAHLGKMTVISEINNDINDFWNQARVFHSTLLSDLQARVPLKESAAMLLGMPKNLPVDVDIFKLLTKMPMGDNYYGTTNMGNLVSTFPGEGEHVQVTDFRRTTSTMQNLCSHVMQTFRGRFIYGIDYEAQLITKETAQLYVNTIFKVLETVTHL